MRREGYIDHRACIGEPGESRDATDEYDPIISKHATIEAYASVDAGTIKATRIDPDAWLFKHSHVGHDAHVMEGAEVSTGVVVGGHAIIGPGARLGINATILPWRVVGARARIGAGAVVTKDVPPGETWAGNPARRMEPNTQPPRVTTCSGCGHIQVTGTATIERELTPSSSAPEPTTSSTPSPPATTTSPATTSANSAPATPLSATDADVAWLAWLESRVTSAKRTTLPRRPQAASTGASAPPVAKSAPSLDDGFDYWYQFYLQRVDL